MTAPCLRAALTAILLATASTGTAMLVLATPAQAQSVRAVVGKPLNEAKALVAAKNWKAAMAKVNEAEAAPNKTPAENQIIAQMKQYIAVQSGDVSIGGVVAAKAKFARDYNDRKFKDVIADGEILRKFNALDANSMQVIAQAYYQAGDKAGCEKYIKSNFGNNAGDSTLELLMRCAYENGDEATQRQALETLVAHTGKPEFWNDLLKISEHAQGMRDPDTLDIYRIKMVTGTLAGKDDYTLLAQLALQLGYPAEAVSVLEKGQAAKILTDERTTKLLALAKSQAGTDAANQPKAIAAAKAAPSGDALIKIGTDQIGQGNAKDAIATIQDGLAKPVKDKNDGLIRLGMAYYYAGQKDQAVKTFNEVKSSTPNDKTAMIAHLWSLAAHH
ncbi:MAG TPA: hypothetical protein VHV26_11700 [Rhizomicrobium sp.]|jgi:tetratricopeptide (TPR) repeat protein|nr:hypothetical protein [Rhizomicrobium sp.]